MYVLSNFDLLCLYYTWQEKGFHKKILGFLQQKILLFIFVLLLKKGKVYQFAKPPIFLTKQTACISSFFMKRDIYGWNNISLEKMVHITQSL